MMINDCEIALIVVVLIYLIVNLRVLSNMNGAFKSLKAKFETFYKYSIEREAYVKKLVQQLNGEK